MSRQLEAWQEEQSEKRSLAIAFATQGGLEQAVRHAGAELIGISIKGAPGDYLMTVRVILAGKYQICFVGSDSIAGVFLKATREGKQDKLSWKEDRYAPGVLLSDNGG